MSKLDLLTANDVLGQYPASHYASDKSPRARPSLEGETSADVCIIGGGLTGVSAALTLAKAGQDVVLLEASRVGFGASGRNGGQIGTGQRIDQYQIEKLVDKDTAHRLFHLGVEAHDYVLKLCDEYGIDIGYQPGIAHVGFNAKEMDHEHSYARYLRDEYGYEKIQSLDPHAMRAEVNSPAYHGGVVDQGAGHGDPLALAIGIAQAAEKAGARIYENSRVTSLSPLQTERGSVKAKQYVLACNGYLGDLHPPTARYVMPINNFIVATEVLGEACARDLIPNNIAVNDSKFVVNYFRRSPDHRLLFGGGESYGYRFPKDLAKKAQKPMVKIFPQLENVSVDYAWGGTLGITMNRLPYIAREDNLWISCGYSGHGLALSTYYGDMTARAILGDGADFETASKVPHRKFPGNANSRHALLVAAMIWYQMRDKIRI